MRGSRTYSTASALLAIMLFGCSSVATTDIPSSTPVPQAEPPDTGVPTATAVPPTETQAPPTETPVPEAPQIYQGDSFTLTYPVGWQIIDKSQKEACQVSGSECLLTIGHPSNDGTNINLVRIGLPSEVDVDTLDTEFWANLKLLYPDAISETRELIEIDGQPASKRIFTLPGRPPGERGPFLYVYIVRGIEVYRFSAYSPNDELFRQHQAELEEIVTSIKFTP